MDIQEIMRQAQGMQKKMLELQEELGREQVSYSVADGLVEATISGRKVPISIKLSQEVWGLENIGLLEDLIMMALSRANEKADHILNQRTEQLMAEVGLPSNFELPS